jgi:hypothetical protein
VKTRRFSLAICELDRAAFTIALTAGFSTQQEYAHVSKIATHNSPATSASPHNTEQNVPPEPFTPQYETDPAGVNAQRSEQAIWTFQDAYKVKETPPVDFSSRALQSLDVRLRTEAAEELLQPGPLLQAAGEAIPPLGSAEPPDTVRHQMIDTLERPTTVAVHASDQRMRLLHGADVLQAGIDVSNTARASNSIEKMLCHEIAAGHAAAMDILGRLRRVGKEEK